MSAPQRVCSVDEIADCEARRVTVNGTDIAVVRSGDEFYAIADVCSHEEVPLSDGDVEDRTIECWLHGSRFDLVTGEPIELPATKPVQVYPVSVDGDDVYVTV